MPHPTFSLVSQRPPITALWRPGLCALVLLSSLTVWARPAAAEEGLVNVHLGLGTGVLANDAAVAGVSRAGLDFSLKVDVPVHRWVAPQIGYGLIYLPGSGGTESGVNLVMVGARVRVLNDEKGFLANLWPRGPRGNAWGNLWVEFGLGYAHAPTVSGDSHWFALEVGVGYEFSLASPLQIGPYVSYRQLLVKQTYPAFVCIGLSISFGYPKKLPKKKTKRERPRPQPRPNIVGRQGERDGDAVGDGSDKCPSTLPGKRVDEAGREYIRGRMVFPTLQFETGSSTLAPVALFAIRRVAELVKAHPEVKVEVGAHTETPGSVVDNLRLSLRRAQVVRDEMVKLGAPTDRLTVKGYGVSMPLVPSKDPDSRKKNTLVEFRFTTGQPKAD